MHFGLIPFLLLTIPVVEIAAFIVIGNQIGIGPTLLMILITAIIGSFLLRHQGLGLVNTIRLKIDAGEVPGKALADGAMIVLAGIFLLTPGFVTDSLGFLLFVPPIRTALWNFLASRITVTGPGGTNPFDHRWTDSFSEQSNPTNPMNGEGDGPVIDLDADDYESNPEDPDSPWNKKLP